MKILFVGENEKINNALSSYMKYYFTMKNKEYVLDIYSPNELKDSMFRLWDVILLDVEMKSISITDFTQLLRKRNKNVIISFINGNEKHIVTSYQSHPFDYIWKPISQIKINDLFEDIFTYYFPDKINIEFITTKGTISVDQSEILYFEYIDKSLKHINRCIEMVTSTDVHIIKGRISDVYNKLDHRLFIQPHRSFIVNFEKIKNVGNYHMYMINDYKIPISQKKWKEFKELYGDYKKHVL